MAVIDRAVCLWSAAQDRGWQRPPSENEAVALLVVPFLLALCWKPRQIAREWKTSEGKRADVMVFDDPDRQLSECRLIVEAKKPPRGLSMAKEQGFGYAVGNENVPILVTDGFNWVLYSDARTGEPIGEIFLPQIRTGATPFLEQISKIMPS